MKKSKSDTVRLLHILDAIREIFSYTNNVSKDEFKTNSMIFYATIKQMEIIGEAANNLSDEIREKHDEIEWRLIVGLRNLLVHEYFGIDAEIV